MKKVIVRCLRCQRIDRHRRIGRLRFKRPSGCSGQRDRKRPALVCDEYGRCWRERVRVALSFEIVRSYAPRERYIDRRGYYDGGYYNDGPSVGIGVGPAA